MQRSRVRSSRRPPTFAAPTHSRSFGWRATATGTLIPHATNQAHRRPYRRRRRSGAERRDPRGRQVRLQQRHRSAGHRRQLRRPHRAWARAGACAQGRHRNSPPGRHDSRHHQSRQSVRVSRVDEHRRSRLLGARHRELSQVRPRRPRRHRRRRHSRHRA